VRYTLKEEKELNNQLNRWKRRQLTAVKQIYIDYAYESMGDVDRSIWSQIAKAETYKDVGSSVWENAERVISKYCRIARYKR